MPTQEVTSPIALDETLQDTNGKLNTQNGKLDSIITKLQGIIDALGLDPSIYKPAGTKTCSELVSSLLIASNLGNVYNITDSGTTTADFVEGAGKPINAGANVAIVDIGTGGTSVYKFDLLAGIIDLSDYVQKSETVGLLKNDGSVDETDYVTSAELEAVADDVEDIQDSLDTDTTSISGNPISIADLKSAQIAVNPVITFEPIQAGSGTPSPSNIRPISGYDKIEVLSQSKNLYADGNISISNTVYAALTLSTPIPAGTYIVSANLSSNSSANARIAFRDSNGTGITATNVVYNSSGRSASNAVTVPQDAYQLYFYVAGIGESGSRTWTDIMIAPSDASTDYVPYHKTTDLSESLGQTVYGGSLDVRSGIFTKIWGYIASYAGETLPSEWISDRDEYVSGTTPTTGAEVAYKLANANYTTIQLTPHEIALSQGYNYISTNGTSISLAYHNGEMARLADVEQLAETVERGRFHRYSTDEQIVGSWIDGKTLYELTVSFGSMEAGTYKDVDMTNYSISKVVYINGSLKTAYSDQIPIPYVNKVATNRQAFVRYQSSQKTLRVFVPDTEGTCTDIYITIRYTKT